MNKSWAVAAMAAAALPLAWVTAGPLGLPWSHDSRYALVVSWALAPFVEEWVLRLGVQAGLAAALARRGWRVDTARWAAFCTASLAFAMIHLPSFSLLGLRQCWPWLVPGVALAALWHWRQRLRESVFMHAWFNVALWLVSR